mgnify:CR=1
MGLRPVFLFLFIDCPPFGPIDCPPPGPIDCPPPGPIDFPPPGPIDCPPPGPIDFPPPGPIESQPPGPIELGIQFFQAWADAEVDEIIIIAAQAIDFMYIFIFLSDGCLCIIVPMTISITLTCARRKLDVGFVVRRSVPQLSVRTFGAARRLISTQLMKPMIR